MITGARDGAPTGYGTRKGSTRRTPENTDLACDYTGVGRAGYLRYEVARSGKNSAISRAADSWESEPCTRFSVVSIA